MSSAYENVVGGKLKLKGKALDVKAASGIKKKKNKKNKQLENNKKNHQLNEQFDDDHETASAAEDNDLLSSGGSAEVLTDPSEEEEVGDASKSAGENVACWDDHLTPAERRYVEQRAEIDMHRLAKTANKSHRDRIQDFNQYLTNMSEHYGIPKVGPG